MMDTGCWPHREPMPTSEDSSSRVASELLMRVTNMARWLPMTRLRHTACDTLGPEANKAEEEPAPEAPASGRDGLPPIDALLFAGVETLSKLSVLTLIAHLASSKDPFACDLRALFPFTVAPVAVKFTKWLRRKPNGFRNAMVTTPRPGSSYSTEPSLAGVSHCSGKQKKCKEKK
jgi:hypothetical protein